MAEEVRKQLLETLASRRKEAVPITLRPAKHAEKPLLQREASVMGGAYHLLPLQDGSAELGTSKQRDGPPKQGNSDVGAQFEQENLVLTVEAGRQGQVPILVLKPKLAGGEVRTGQAEQRPAVIFLHGTGGSKEMMRPFMQAFVALGYVAVAIDSRYHGDRADSVDAYSNALISAWKTGLEMPFIFDTVWDLIKLMDYLTGRPDICPTRIGMMGISLGGMHAWFAAAADPRVAAVVPFIGVQCFSWAIDKNCWHARVRTIPAVFSVAKEDLGQSEVDASTVSAVWNRIAPGLIDNLDAEHTLPAICPRPLLILNGMRDPRCPVAGLVNAVTKTAQVYRQAGVPDHFEFVTEDVGHTVSKSMCQYAKDWFEKHLASSYKSGQLL